MRTVLVWAIFAGFLCAQPQPGADWRTATTLPGIDFSGLNAEQRAAALKMLREETCNCGCNYKIAECRIKDPQCGYSRALALKVVSELRAGKSPEEVRKILLEAMKAGPEPTKILEDPVPISIAGDPVRGPAGARITLIEFSDFQCPYCAAAVSAANEILKMYPKDVKLVFKEFPLDMHPQAHLAAEAALAANAQGKFWQLHDKMFANFRRLSRANIMEWAKEIGLNMDRFTADLNSGKYRKTVDREIDEGMAAGVMGTPTFYIDGKRYNGVMDPSALKPILDAELKGGSKVTVAAQSGR
jgi:protein-disulfide isomerase